MAERLQPLISCLCVTKNERIQLERAIKCFKAQTYSRKELVIVYEADSPTDTDWISKLDDPEIKIVKVSLTPKKPLGELRNISVHHASGEYFCQWDDDDWHHADRLTVQVTHAVNYMHTATFLTNWLIYDQLKEKAYFSQFRLWEGSILCKRNVFPLIKYPSSGKSEDTQLVLQLLKKGKVFPIVYPNLYIYVFHGKNTWNRKHFNNLINNGQKLSKASSNLVGEILNGAYSVKKASRLLHSAPVIADINYFHKRQIPIDLLTKF